jgi:hypothetical protein
MPTFTVSISKELKKRLDKMPEINWSEYIKKGFEERLKQLQKFEELVAKGKI